MKHTLNILAGLSLAGSALAQNPQPLAGAVADGDIRGLHDALSMPVAAAAGDAALYPWLLLAGAVAALAVWFAWRRRARVVPRSAEQLAREALAAAHVALHENGNSAEAALLMESAVRDYLQARFGFPAEARTTTEIARLLPQLESEQPVLAASAGQLVRLLHTCEEAVFGREPIGANEWQELTTTANHLIERREAELAAQRQRSGTGRFVAQSRRIPQAQPKTEV